MNKKYVAVKRLLAQKISLSSLKTYLPNRLFGRFLLIIVLPSIIVQVVAIYIFYERHWSSVSRHMERALAGDVAMVARLANNKPLEDQQKIFTRVKETLYLRVSFKEHERLYQYDVKSLPEYDILMAELATRLPLRHSVYYDTHKDNVLFEVQLENGLLTLFSSRKRLTNPSTYIFVLWMIGTSFIVVLISLIFMRNQVRPIAALAKAAERFGKGGDLEGFKPTGALEVRKAAEAFIRMQQRINRQVQQRMDMLAGVSHDLKTPLTRVKLQLAMMSPSPTIKDLQDDIEEMQKMVQGYLDFAKGKEKAPVGPVNIADELRSIISGYRKHHHAIGLKAQAGIIITLNSNYFRRAVSNIVDNAIRYSHNIDVQANANEYEMSLTIDDDGPGIALNKRELVFKPFYRLDQSRNLETGGTGLGLSIAKDIIVGYGGDIILDSSPMGGLRVLITLPL